MNYAGDVHGVQELGRQVHVQRAETGEGSGAVAAMRRGSRAG